MSGHCEQMFDQGEYMLGDWKQNVKTKGEQIWGEQNVSGNFLPPLIKLRKEEKKLLVVLRTNLALFTPKGWKLKQDMPCFIKCNHPNEATDDSQVSLVCHRLLLHNSWISYAVTCRMHEYCTCMHIFASDTICIAKM